MNTAYSKERILAIENNMYQQTLAEMPNEYARWGDPNNILGQMFYYSSNHQTFKSQLSKRTSQVRDHIQSNFSLPNQVDVTLDVNPPDGGKIQISTVTPDSYPWQGVYFNGVPVRIEAVPSPGYTFLHWDSSPLIKDSLNCIFNDTLDAGSVNVTACFANFTYAKSFGQTSDFLLYPNPAKENINLLNNGNKSYTDLRYCVIDMNGRVVQEGILSHSGRELIDINSIPSAVYVICIYDSDGPVDQFRFVKTIN
jgi:hypothetical protein